MTGKPKLKLYMLTQNAVSGYDTYDSAVVAATSPTAAKRFHPNEDHAEWSSRMGCWVWSMRPTDPYESASWASSPDAVEATLIGYAHASTKPGLVLASFNAG